MRNRSNFLTVLEGHPFTFPLVTFFSFPTSFLSFHFSFLFPGIYNKAIPAKPTTAAPYDNCKLAAAPGATVTEGSEGAPEDEVVSVLTVDEAGSTEEAGALETGALETGALEAGALEAGALEAGALDSADSEEAGAEEAGAEEAGAEDSLVTEALAELDGAEELAELLGAAELELDWLR